MAAFFNGIIPLMIENVFPYCDCSVSPFLLMIVLVRSIFMLRLMDVFKKRQDLRLCESIGLQPLLLRFQFRNGLFQVFIVIF